MPIFSVVIHPISDLLKWHSEHELVLQPKFQRRGVWSTEAMSYLIDTIVRGLPMPMVYLRVQRPAGTAKRIYEVVDGQQRLNSIIQFVEGQLALSKKHHDQLGGSTFEQLPDAVQRVFMEYKLSVQIVERATDQEIWALFERLNSYTLTLNRQEKLNARWFGEFKQVAYSLAASQSSIETWRQLGIFSYRQISRMSEVEMTSDLLVAFIKGVSEITEISHLYKEFDDSFPEKEKVAHQFESLLAVVSESLGDVIRTTAFRRKTWFYSLLVALADCMFAIPNGFGPAEIQSTTIIRERLIQVDETWNLQERPAGLDAFRDAVSRGTSHQRERKVRHNILFSLVAAGDPEWERAINSNFE